MNKIVFDSIEALAECMMTDANKGDTAYAVCFLDDASELLRELMRFTEVTIGGINITKEEYNGYSKEYFISLDGDMVLDIEPAWHESNEYHNAGYLWFDAEKVYIVGEASSTIIKDIDEDKCFEIGFEPLKDDCIGDFLMEILEDLFGE